MKAQHPIQDVSSLNERGLERANDPMSDRGQFNSHTLGWDLSKVVNERNRPKLGNYVSVFDFRDEGKNCVVKSRDIYNP